jgi:UDP-N-acetylglucosamine 1-carboxyvinyltransferase
MTLPGDGERWRPARLSIDVHGGPELLGQVPISGYKHALTVVVAAAVALSRVVSLRNVPMNTETRVLHRILLELGAGSELADGVWELDTRPIVALRPIPGLLSRQVHGSVYLAPALLARFGEVSFPGAGGDRIGPAERDGERPIEQVGAVMERFGASVETRGDGLYASASSLRGCHLDLLEFSSDSEHQRLRGPRASSATKTALLLATAARGRTTLCHPVDRDATWELCDFLRACGAAVTQADDTWCVQGAARDGPVVHRLISDSSEIITFIAGAAHVGGSLELTGITGDRTWRAIAGELQLLRKIGVPMTLGPTWLGVGRAERLEPTAIEIECNGISTDSHPLLALVLLGASGDSAITDHVWTNRFAYARLLEHMGARVRIEGSTIHLGPSRLRRPPQPLVPTDSRAAAVALLAGLGVDGTTTIQDRGHLDRSYDCLIDKLRAVGAQIEVGGPEAGS